MNYKRTGEAVYGNQNRTGEAGSDLARSSSKVGHQSPHARSVGSGSQQTPRSCAGGTSANSRSSHGGQTSLPCFFGLRIADTGAPRASEVKACSAQGEAVTPSPVRPVGDQQPRRVGGLSYGQRRARLHVLMHRPVAAVAMNQAAAAAAAEQRDERDWNSLADLAAAPEWDRTLLPFGSVETACALD